MGEFFKPWRRKLGILGLLMGCMLMIGWLRSRNRFEGVAFPTEHGPTVCLVSWDSSLVWLTEYAGNFGKYPVFRSRLLTGIEGHFFESPHYEWRWKKYGFGVGDGVDAVNRGNRGNRGNRVERSTLTIVPYWSIVLPLTSISAWLLLSKPRRPATVPSDEAV